MYGWLLNARAAICDGNKACMRISGILSERFNIEQGKRQGYVMTHQIQENKTKLSKIYCKGDN